MAEPANPDLFVSYARADVEIATELGAALRDRGLSVWWDADIQEGGSFREDILDAVDRARCVIVIWSPVSVKSPWVQEEALVGIDRKVLFPLMWRDCTPPPGLGALQALRIPEAPERRRELFERLAENAFRILDERQQRPRRGLTTDISSYFRLTLRRNMAVSAMIALGLTALFLPAIPWLLEYQRSIPNAEATTASFVAALIFAIGGMAGMSCFVARLFVGGRRAPRTAPERYFSARMNVTLALVLLIMGYVVWAVAQAPETEALSTSLRTVGGAFAGALALIPFAGLALLTLAPIIRVIFVIARSLYELFDTVRFRADVWLKERLPAQISRAQ